MELEELKYSLRLHISNYMQLKGFADDLMGDSDENVTKILKRWEVTNRAELDAITEEANRLFHNFLASAQLLP